MYGSSVTIPGTATCTSQSMAPRGTKVIATASPLPGQTAIPPSGMQAQ
jgi:hypothetical protein